MGLFYTRETMETKRFLLPRAGPGALRLMPAAGGFSVGDVTGNSRRAETVISGAGCGGDAGRRVGVRIRVDLVFARAQPEEQVPGDSQQLARLDLVFAPATFSQTYCSAAPKL
jgi:hypothetical protein